MHLVKITIDFGVDWPWPVRSNLTKKLKFYNVIVYYDELIQAAIYYLNFYNQNSPVPADGLTP